ncbi:bifunctional 3'-5' exonuclease/DNA polymerase [Cellulomonas edaphi]|uniref:DNA-directed DNA polymerase n=1 Tax=Cellulomonas edaphi TaxID=3053468 RepID=A0ABT7S4T9_9CELL|nr:bifunctional 3'-5' exonuclease/DNA polymerase [Cellulomons edaphi]MDM7830627.1 bifunctional 3'-5' exonuclease/DNA polymerase [Cellulomons edaphi]
MVVAPPAPVRAGPEGADGLVRVGEVPGDVAPHGVVGAAVGGEKAVRWAWDDTARWYPRLLADGVRVERCLDLRLAHRLLRGSATTAGSRLATGPVGPFDGTPDAPPEPDAVDSLFDVARTEDRPGADELLAEIGTQDEAVAGHARLRLLLVAESAGALAAAEMRHTGLPWDRAVHDEVLAEQLGPRPLGDARPPRMAELAEQVRAELGAPRLNPDSLPDVLRELRRNGLAVNSTSKWELQGVDHPAVAPLLAYKKLSRLNSANGWTWLDRWVPDGRFRPEYVVGGVVTGRWGSSGGGALQLPKQVRRAVRADDGWRLVVADAAQLEPRVLAGLARDEQMAEAGRGRDLYQGMVDAGVVDSRDHAKLGMLGALYGGTTGQSAAVLPRINRAFPAAMAHVEAAARAGERGEVVSTLLGRSSPRPGAQWNQVQADALDDDAGAGAQSRARSQTRAWGRFTRNFVVQGTAAEWALCWIAEVRRRLWAMGEAGGEGRVPAPFARRPHLVYFLHDELVIHAPDELADAVADQVRAAAAAAGRLLFGDFPVDFPVSLAAARSYADAKG